MSDSITIPFPWVDLRSPGADARSRRLEVSEEFSREVHADHPLHGITFDVVARSVGGTGDEVVLALRTGGWAIVRLSWSGELEMPPTPEYALHEDLASLDEALRILPDGLEIQKRASQSRMRRFWTALFLSSAILLVIRHWSNPAIPAAWREFEHAWSVWATGSSASQLPLWGHTVMWWARLGKVLSFVAGIVVVLDLIGPSRLRNLGRGSSNTESTIAHVWRRFIISLVHRWNVPAPQDAFRDVRSFFKVAAIMIIANLLLLPVMLLVLRPLMSTKKLLWDENPGHILRWISFFLFLTGSTLDFLGS